MSRIETPLLKAAVNGGRTLSENAHVPLTPLRIAADAAAARDAGADLVHAHARTASGDQSIHPDEIGSMVAAVREHAPGVLLGTTTGLWTCSGHRERMSLVEQWPEDLLPDFASVAFSEVGAAEAAQLVLDRGMELETAVWSLGDIPALLAAPALDRFARVLIEPEDEDATTAISHARAMAERLRAEGVRVPLIYHGYDSTAWPMVTAAVEDGAGLRVGFEDMVDLADGSPARSNAAMVRLARREQIARRDRR